MKKSKLGYSYPKTFDTYVWEKTEWPTLWLCVCVRACVRACVWVGWHVCVCVRACVWALACMSILGMGMEGSALFDNQFVYINIVFCCRLFLSWVWVVRAYGFFEKSRSKTPLLSLLLQQPKQTENGNVQAIGDQFSFSVSVFACLSVIISALCHSLYTMSSINLFYHTHLHSNQKTYYHLYQQYYIILLQSCNAIKRQYQQYLYIPVL